MVDYKKSPIAPCNPGSLLFEEFPSVELVDQYFPADYARSVHIKPTKTNPEYDDVPTLPTATAKRFGKYLKESLSEREILVVTQGSFCHFLFNQWDGEPGKSRSCG